MSSEKNDLARAGTMQVTAKEGKGFLDRNLTEWKKPYLMDQFEGEEGEDAAVDGDEDEEEERDDAPKAKKSKMSKHSTMKGTAKEAAAYFADKDKPDDDVLTRGQQKKLAIITSEKPAPKKGRMSKSSTMVHTAKEGKELLGSAKMGDTRAETGRKQKKGAVKRATTIDKVKEEAAAVFGNLDHSEGRSMRKRPKRDAPAPKAKKPAQKKKETKAKGKK